MPTLKHYFLMVLLYILTQHIVAQEYIAPLQSNSALVKKNSTWVAKKTRGLSLPFIDDFSSTAPYPNTSNWINNKVYINNTFGVGAPTRGVATFDGLDESGKSYSAASISTYFVADTLTSQEIILGNYTAADSIYLSFLYQPQGNGFMPDAGDSLYLQFYTLSGTWQTVWGVPGSAVHPFKVAMVGITSSLFLHNNFQFRLLNKVSPNTNDDIWNVDMVRLDKFRSKLDTNVVDIAFTQEPRSIMRYYSSMPYRQFINYTGLEQDTAYAAYMRNNSGGVYNGNVNVVCTANGILQKNDVKNISLPIKSNGSANYGAYTVNYIPSNANATVAIKHKYFISKPSATDITSNDTIEKTELYSNYLAYDDGSCEKAYFLLPANNIPSSTALEFHLNQTDTLTGLALHFANQVPSGAGKIFSIALYNHLGATTSTQQLITQQDFYTVQYADSLNGFSYYKLDSAVVLAPGTYYIGTTQPSNLGADSIYFGLDANNNTNANHLYYNVDGTWNQSAIAGSVMMHPVLGGGAFTAVSIKEEKIKSNITIFPNPCKGIITMTGIPKGNCSYNIRSTTGAVVKTGVVIEGGQVDVSSLASGAYLLQLINESINTTHIFNKQ